MRSIVLTLKEMVSDIITVVKNGESSKVVV